MNTPTLSQLADIGAEAAHNRMSDDQDDPSAMYVSRASARYASDAPAREAFTRAVLDAVGYNFPVDPEREAFDAWYADHQTEAGKLTPFDVWKAGRNELREKWDLILRADREPPVEPETFEAHGLTWFKHTPGDPMPCDEDALTQVIWSSEVRHTGMRLVAQKARFWDWSTVIVGWRYATPPADAP